MKLGQQVEVKFTGIITQISQDYRGVLVTVYNKEHNITCIATKEMVDGQVSEEATEGV